MSAKKKTAKKKTARRRVVKRKQVKVGTNTRVGNDPPITQADEREWTGDLPEHPGEITIAGGLTKSTGVQFEFVRVDVHVTVPCVPTEEGYRQSAAKASDLVDELIQSELSRAFGEEG